MAKIAGDLLENTKSGMSRVSQQLGLIQDYFVKQIKMADCCNNVQLEPSLMTNLNGEEQQRGTLGMARYS